MRGSLVQPRTHRRGVRGRHAAEAAGARHGAALAGVRPLRRASRSARQEKAGGKARGGGGVRCAEQRGAGRVRPAAGCRPPRARLRLPGGVRHAGRGGAPPGQRQGAVRRGRRGHGGGADGAAVGVQPGCRPGELRRHEVAHRAGHGARQAGAAGGRVVRPTGGGGENGAYRFSCPPFPLPLPSTPHSAPHPPSPPVP